MTIKQRLALLSSILTIVVASPNTASAASAEQQLNGGVARQSCFINGSGRLAPWSLTPFNDQLVGINMELTFVPNGPARRYFFGLLPQPSYNATAQSTRSALSTVLSGSALGVLNGYSIPAFVAQCT